MPSGVSHGSVLPVGAAVASRSKATSAKLGMRLMGPTISEVSAGLIMVRMLMADDGRHLLRPVILLRGLARQVGDANHPAEAGFGPVLPGRHQLVGAVEGTCHDLDPVPVDAAETQRRAAGRAIAALGDGGGSEERGLPLGPGKIRPVDVGERGKGRTRRLLAHPAMADRNLVRRRRDRKADRAALAAAGENWF